ncbi:MAG: pyrroline-5-carboxylate reductase [Deltaproteobacteria bacterium]|nr:pyrroline-5-carboxylate reductase [Deltaproteobacteria bacterium]
MDIAKSRIGIIGGGNMGQAILKGLSSGRPPAGLLAWDALAACRERLVREFPMVTVPENNRALVAASDIVILAVKPQVIGPVMAEIGPDLNEKQLLISIAAGVPCRRLEEHLDRPVPTIRIMPNTPALINRGISAIAAGSNAEKSHLENAQALFSCLGETVIVPESAMDMVTAVSGSGPAYVFLVIEALTDAAVGLGLARDLARKLVVETILGSTELLKSSGRHPMELKDMVTSPGGTTIAGLAELEKYGLRHAFNAALQSACQRSRELGG